MSQGCDFARIMAKRCGITQKEARSVVELFVETLKYCMVTGIEVQIRGMFKIGSKKREAYIYHDPRTGSMDSKPETRMPYCKFSNQIREALNTEGFTGEVNEIEDNSEDEGDEGE